MNKKGNIMISLMFYIMALGVVIAFISPINSFLNMARQSDNLNCRGYIHNGDSGNPLSFNSTLNDGNSGSPIGCLVTNMVVAYILLVFLIGGVSSVLAGKVFGFGQEETEY